MIYQRKGRLAHRSGKFRAEEGAMVRRGRQYLVMLQETTNSGNTCAVVYRPTITVFHFDPIHVNITVPKMSNYTAG